MTKVLIISPQAGFGNRMRALRSGLYIAMQTGRIPYHAWHRTEPPNTEIFEHVQQMSSGFSHFFTGIPEATCELFPSVDVCLSEWLPGEFWHPRQSYAQTHWNVTNVIRANDVINQCNSSDQVILLETSLEHVECLPSISTQLYKTYFKPKIEHTQRYTVGIQLRRDPLFFKFFPEAITTDEQIINWFNAIVSKLKPESLVVSCDTSFIEKLGYTKHDWFTDFLALSNCAIVFGTPRSSFGEEAALFGGAQYSRISAI